MIYQRNTGQINKGIEQNPFWPDAPEEPDPGNLRLWSEHSRGYGTERSTVLPSSSKKSQLTGPDTEKKRGGKERLHNDREENL